MPLVKAQNKKHMLNSREMGELSKEKLLKYFLENSFKEYNIRQQIWEMSCAMSFRLSQGRKWKH